MKSGESQDLEPLLHVQHIIQETLQPRLYTCGRRLKSPPIRSDNDRMTLPVSTSLLNNQVFQAGDQPDTAPIFTNALKDNRVMHRASYASRLRAEAEVAAAQKRE